MPSLEFEFLNKVKSLIPTYMDFPSKGINFYDIMPLFQNPFLIAEICHIMSNYPKNGFCVNKVVAFESRGFLFGVQIAKFLNVGFVPIRKFGKLPGPVITSEAIMEYGTSVLQIQKGSINSGDKILLIDDVLATGGTLKSGIKLIESVGGIINDIGVLIELSDLNGRQKMEGYALHSLLQYGTQGG